MFSVLFYVFASAYLTAGSTVISVARFVGRNSTEDGASSSIVLIAFEFGLSIFVLV